jgi:hypothetical protein
MQPTFKILKQPATKGVNAANKKGNIIQQQYSGGGQLESSPLSGILRGGVP